MDDRNKYFTDRVVKDESGVYRWYYDMDMRHNHYLRNVLFKVMGAVCVMIFLMFMFMFSESDLGSGAIWIAVGLPGGMFLLTALGYWLATLIMKGTYRVYFSMDDESIQLVRSKGTQAMMNSLGTIGFAAGMAAGKTGEALRTGAMLSGAAGSGLTRFSDVRGITEHPEWDSVNLRELAGANQIWIPREDYDFVINFIREHVQAKKEKAENSEAKKKTARICKRIGWSFLVSALVNLACLAYNISAFNKTGMLPLSVSYNAGQAIEQRAFALRLYYMADPEFHAAWANRLITDTGLAMIGLIAVALAAFLVLSLVSVIRRKSYGE